MTDSQTFVYDEVAFVDFFNSLPKESSEWGRDISYSHEKHGIKATFDYNLDTGDCSLVLCLSNAEAPFVSFVYLDRPSIEIKRERESASLEVKSPGKFRGLQLWLYPSIRVEHFSS